ncbi:MAG: hypothetical protein JJE55_08250 [Flavobacteriaceae bacterium]|nr:hypothetical protein [Flavobacteriaceae bacterium]
MLPGIKITFDNGNIGTVVSTADGIFGFIASAVAVVDKFALNTPYSVRGMVDVAKLGILPDVNNGVLYKKLKEYYAEAGEGTKVWLMGRAKTETPSEWFTPDGVTGIIPAKTFVDASNGEISLLMTSFDPDGLYVVALVTGLDADVWLAKAAAQTFCEDYTENQYSPLIVILEGYAFSGTTADLPSLLESTDNRVGIFIGDSAKQTGDVTNNNQANHILGGRLANIGVEENAGKVKLGELATTTAFIVDEPVEAVDVESIHDKGYITFRTHVRRAGYYISDDPLATGLDDDYHYITRRRTIDKAYRIAHNVASREILNDFDVTNAGTVSPIYARSVEAALEQEIYNQMTQQGELSADSTNKDDLGVKAKFNTTINVAQTSRLELSLKVRPKGYARWIEITLGYDVSLN